MGNHFKTQKQLFEWCGGTLEKLYKYLENNSCDWEEKEHVNSYVRAALQPMLKGYKNFNSDVHAKIFGDYTTSEQTTPPIPAQMDPLERDPGELEGKLEEKLQEVEVIKQMIHDKKKQELEKKKEAVLLEFEAQMEALEKEESEMV